MENMQYGVELEEVRLIKKLKLTSSHLSEILETISLNSVRQKKKREQAQEAVDSMNNDLSALLACFVNVEIENVSEVAIQQIKELTQSNLKFESEYLDIKRQYLDIKEQYVDLLKENELLKSENNGIERQYIKLLRLYATSERNAEKLLAENLVLNLDNEKNSENNSILNLKIKQAIKFIHSLQNKYEDLLSKENRISISNQKLLCKYLELQEVYMSQISNTNSELTPIKQEMVDLVKQGAVDLVKNNISYRLGRVFTKNSANQTLSKIPGDLIGELRDFLLKKVREDISLAEQLGDYVDVDEAELYKKHLSYRLGKVLIEDIFLSKNIKKLPVSFFEEFVAFKKSKQNKLK